MAIKMQSTGSLENFKVLMEFKGKHFHDGRQSLYTV